jgi:signal transduction histidine kinase
MDDRVNILLVDDEPGKLLSYEAILSSLGENLIKADSGRQALEQILHADIAVVLLDVCMPDLDGFELASLIRQHPRFQKTALIFVSAVQIADLDQLRGYECGAVDYVPVPVVPEILRARVSVFVDLYRKTRKLEQFNRELERRVAERTRELEASTARLREADHRKDEFLAMLAHELRNPLAPIRNAVALLKQIGPVDPRASRAQEIIDRQVGHMSHLLEDLLDVSRITRGKVELRPVCLDLVPLVRQTSEDFRPELERAGITLTLDLPEGPLWANADSTRLAQVLGNLLSNAAKFTESGGYVRVRLAPGSGPSACGERSSAVLTVSDTGIGIEPEMLARIFDVFAQADRSLDRSRGGLGLGLALVKGLVELHGGDVWARSEGPERGAEFNVRLPLVTPVRAPVERSHLSLEVGTSTLRVLMIEDNRDHAETLQALLESAGHQVAVAHSGPAGVAMAGEFQPEVVLCDIGLPGMDGYAVARALRQAPALSGTRLVALSGYAQEEDRQRSWDAGFDAHVAKPIAFEALQRLLAGA